MCSTYEDETVEFWLTHTPETLANTAAVLHRERRSFDEKAGYHEVMGARKLIANAFISGSGVEVGAGNRPFPVPHGVIVNYGDIRDGQTLEKHFSDTAVSYDGEIDAETFAAIPLDSLDFILSAHVIEHLHNPFGSIREGIRRIKSGGVYVIVIPDMRFTSDRNRQPTEFEHLASDLEDGGKSTLLQSYHDHCVHVHPLSKPAIEPDAIIQAALNGLENKVDIHVHTWTRETFQDHLERLEDKFDFNTVFASSVQNEAVFVLKRR